MIGKVCSVLLCVALFITGTAGQIGYGSTAENNSSSPQTSQVDFDDKRKGLEIFYSYDAEGKLSKVTIRSNQINEGSNPRLPSLIKREDIMTVIEDIIPESKRGVRVREIRTSFGRAFGDSITYEKVQIDVTTTCRDDVCGVSYAEVRWRSM